MILDRRSFVAALATFGSLSGFARKAAGFVGGEYVDAAQSPHVLARWSADGHIIGNHIFEHGYFSEEDPASSMADILRCEPPLPGYSGFRKLFRFPFLAEGTNAVGRDAIRGLLKQHGYRNAHVTIDISDCYIDNRLKARLRAQPRSSLELPPVLP